MTSSAAQSLPCWAETHRFNFPPDVERKGIQRQVQMCQATLQRNREFIARHSEKAKQVADCENSSGGLLLHLPSWMTDTTEGDALAYVVSLLFSVYSKCGGDEAVIVIDGCPPVAVLNPCGLAPMRDEPFAEIVSDVALKLYSSQELDTDRRKVANQLHPPKASDPMTSALLGSSCILHGRTKDRMGLEPFSKAFDMIWVLQYLGSKENAIELDLCYNGAMFHKQTASTLLQMVRQLHGTPDLSTKNINQLNTLDAEMMFRLQEEWQPPIFSEKEYTTTTPDLFKQQMLTQVPNPKEKIAIIEPSTKREVTYYEFDELSSKLCIFLHQVFCKNVAHRFGDDAVIGIYLPRCADWYIIMLALHKAGAAYLSLDPDFPVDRLLFALEDSDSICLITLSSMADQLSFKGPKLCIDEKWEEIKNVSLSQEIPKPTQPHTPAYLIYTSGSTGKPKGVLIEHINVCSFILSERKLFHLGNNHRIIQGFSTCFDASVEEIWLAFASGSTLIVVEKQIMQDADALTDLIMEYGVTVISTVPSLLATMEADRLKQLKLVIVGGEACNKEVVDAYAAGEDRVLVNSYGPTEATVACTADFCEVSKAVTIGRAQPNYLAYIVDERKKLLPPGVPGELCIAGPGVARGYVNRPELTKEKFVDCPFHSTFTRMYCTGDLVRWNPEGKLEFLGRIDSQVKLRGFRIEVSEIENNLASFSGVVTAVVILRNDGGVPQLVAYIVCEPQLEENFVENNFRMHLKQFLPHYMIPSRFCPITTIPRSPAGKVDRKGFPEPELPKNDRSETADGQPKLQPATPTEYLLHDIWSKHLPTNQTISTADNFFEIGGHSLLAGKVSSSIRKAGFDQFSIRYLYSHPTIKSLAEAMDQIATLKRPEPPVTTLPHRYEPSFLRRVFFLLLNLIVAHLVFFTISGYIFFFLYLYGVCSQQLNERVGTEWSYVIQSFTLSITAIASTFIYMYIWVPLLKWVIIFKYREGTHSIWSVYYLRWWAVRCLTGIIPVAFFQGTVWLNMYLRLMGAKIGTGAAMSSAVADYDLVEIGPDTWIGGETAIVTSEVIDSVLILRKVRIGTCSSVGVRCVVRGGAIVGNQCVVGPLSLVHENVSIPDGETWGGSPAVKTGLVPSLADLLPSLKSAKRSAFEEATAINRGSFDESTALLLTPAVTSQYDHAEIAVRMGFVSSLFLAIFHLLYVWIVIGLCSAPTMFLFLFIWHEVGTLQAHHKLVFFLLAIPILPVVVGILVVYMHIVLIILRWIVLPWKVKPGNYPVNGLMYHRKVFFDILMRISLLFSHPMYASIYTQYLLKALGTDIGRRVECSNLYGFTPGLIKLGDESFVADFVGVNPPEIFRGVMCLGMAEVEARAFVGNGAVLPGGTVLREKSLLGLLSMPTTSLQPGTTYIGSPAFAIPRQAKNELSGEEASKTYEPTCGLVAARLLWEYFRTVAPATCGTFSIVASFLVVNLLVPDLFALVDFLKVYSLFIWIAIVVSLLQVLIIKWTIVGREKPAEYPLWSGGVWRAEFVVDVVTVLGGNSFLNLTRGTPMLPWYFRLLGAKIGKDCWFDTLFITEPDLVTIGDNVCLGDRVTIQTHLFEDRVMKLDKLKIEDRCSIGPLSILLYNTLIERGATIGPLSLVMKGENYPCGTHWEGVPAQRRGVPAVMAPPPRSAPKISVIPATNRPKSEKSKEEPSNVNAGITTEIVEALKEWLLDDGSG